MIINLNQRCDVILTEHGAEVYNKHFREQHAICKLIELTNLKAGEVLSLLLWELMSIFGEHLYNGAENCFENNDISFNDKVVNVPERSREEIKELLDNWKGTIVAGGDISISPWISVEERLPEVNQQVYAAIPNLCGTEYATLEYLGDNRWRQDTTEYTYEFSEEVTYWMPIPELPKEE